MSKEDFEFPQLDKLVQWFIHIYLKDTNCGMDSYTSERLSEELKSFIESIIADTVRLC